MCVFCLRRGREREAGVAEIACVESLQPAPFSAVRSADPLGARIASRLCSRSAVMQLRNYRARRRPLAAILIDTLNQSGANGK